MYSDLRLALWISGSGTTMEAILRAIASGRLRNITPALVVASTREIAGIARALAAGIPEKNFVRGLRFRPDVRLHYPRS
ncbi:MAG: hypothetical protein U1A16_03545 [Patescibacteria group bacterium]|nr:hypothetical protein [Patescibacteria group bacterium]